MLGGFCGRAGSCRASAGQIHSQGPGTIVAGVCLRASVGCSLSSKSSTAEVGTSLVFVKLRRAASAPSSGRVGDSSWRPPAAPPEPKLAGGWRQPRHAAAAAAAAPAAAAAAAVPPAAGLLGRGRGMRWLCPDARRSIGTTSWPSAAEPESWRSPAASRWRREAAVPGAALAPA